MLHFMLQLLGSCYQQLGPGSSSGPAATLGTSGGPCGGAAAGGSATAVAGLPGAGAGEPPWIALESVLYAANVVVGRRAPEIDPSSVLQLLLVRRCWVLSWALVMRSGVVTKGGSGVCKL